MDTKRTLWRSNEIFFSTISRAERSYPSSVPNSGTREQITDPEPEFVI